MMTSDQANRVSRAVFVLTIVFQAACANAITTEEKAAEAVFPMLSEQACVENSKWVVPGSRQVMTTSQVLPRITNRNVVLLGEFHDSDAHHQWQLHTISALYGVKSDLAIGLEMLPSSAQPALDAWVAGRMGLEEFLLASKWYEYWKFDIELYRPILEFARINKVPLYGLNVERSLVQRVSQEGWDNVPLEERHGITDPAPPKQAYLEVLASSFAMHGPGKKSHGAVEVDMEAMNKDPKFKRFVQGQQLWDRGMAHTIATIHKVSPSTQIVAIMGSGHIMNNLGVPYQLRDLGVDSVSVLLPWDGDEDCEMITDDVADAVFGVKDLPSEDSKNKPKLGVVIENTDEGVLVTQVIDNSVAAVTGIEKGDYLVEMAGVVPTKVMDVIESVQQTAAGRWLPIVILRGGERITLVAKFPSSSN